MTEIKQGNVVIINCELKPLYGKPGTKSRKVYVEQVLLSIDDYPTCLFHVDCFWEGHQGDNELHDLLSKGETVKDVDISVKFYHETEE